ncbi:MAG: hypothetical protein QOJ94_1572 [Sphingomonadales bacterium]|jgi:hypothetical protein|nr:hypothetical protein [Sphingomonadales bacterium]
MAPDPLRPFFMPAGGFRRGATRRMIRLCNSWGIVSPIRIQLGQMPALLSRIVDDLLLREPDMLVVGRSPDGDPLREARDNRADMLITQDEYGGGGTCLETILASPPLNILAISRDGLTGARISLSRRPVNLGADGRATLAEAIRGLAMDG